MEGSQGGGRDGWAGGGGTGGKRRSTPIAALGNEIWQGEKGFTHGRSITACMASIRRRDYLPSKKSYSGCTQKIEVESLKSPREQPARERISRHFSESLFHKA